MKPEQRQQIESNDLAQAVVDGGQKLGGFIVPVLAGLAVISCLSIAYSIYSSRNASKVGEGWSDFLSAQTPEDVVAVEKQYVGTKVEPAAQLRMAYFRFQEGKDQLIPAREEGIKKLKEAAATFGELARKRSSFPEVARQAAYAEGLAIESQGDIQKAIATYKLVEGEYPNTNEGFLAKERAEMLSKPGAEKFYTELASYKPPQVSTDLPAKAIDSNPLAPLGAGAKPAAKTDVPAPPKVEKKEEAPKPAAAKTEAPAAPEKKEEPKAETKPAATPEAKTESKPVDAAKPEAAEKKAE